MGNKLPDNDVPDPETTAPDRVILTITGWTLCPNFPCTALSALPDPWSIYLFLTNPTIAEYKNTEGYYSVTYVADTSPNNQTTLYVNTSEIGSNPQLFRHISLSNSKWETRLPNNIITCSAGTCAYGGYASIATDAEAADVAEAVGVPEESDRFYEPFIQSDGNPTYRYATRRLSTNVIIQTE